MSFFRRKVYQYEMDRVIHEQFKRSCREWALVAIVLLIFTAMGFYFGQWHEREIQRNRTTQSN